jgi:hypothetical protein
VAAEPLPAGAWTQTSSTAGDCAACEVTVTQVTAHIIQLTSNKGWTGFALYEAPRAHYAGVFEWIDGEPGEQKDTPVCIPMTYQGQTLTMDAAAGAFNFKATFRKK